MSADKTKRVPKRKRTLPLVMLPSVSSADAAFNHRCPGNPHIVNALESHRVRMLKLWQAANALLASSDDAQRDANLARLNLAVADTRYLSNAKGAA